MASRANRTTTDGRSHPVTIACALRQGRSEGQYRARPPDAVQGWSEPFVRACGDVRERTVLDNVGQGT